LITNELKLSRIQDIIRNYGRALSGRGIEIQALKDLVAKNIGWIDSDLPTTDGTTIFLPDAVNLFTTEDENFAWYKVITTHQVGHIEFGSFDFDFDRPSTMFDDIRPDLARISIQPPAKAVDQKQASFTTDVENFSETSFPTDLTRFFNLFPDDRLARDIFMLVEDTRIDYRIMEEYQGLVPIYTAAQARSLTERPGIEELPALEAFVEFIVRLSLHQDEGLKVPEEYANAAYKTRKLVRCLAEPGAVIEDAAEITIRIYSLLCDIPNTIQAEHLFQRIEPVEEKSYENQHVERGVKKSKQVNYRQDRSNFYGNSILKEGERELAGAYTSPKQVAFRGEFKPELAQFLSQIRIDGKKKNSSKTNRQILRGQLEILMRLSPEVDSRHGKMPDHLQWRMLIDNLMKEMAERLPMTSGTSRIRVTNRVGAWCMKRRWLKARPIFLMKQ